MITPAKRGGTAHYLRDSLDVHGGAAGALFCVINKGNNLLGIGRNMIPDALRQTLDKRGIEAGLDPLSWHDFRRTYISDLINQYDLVTAQKIVGHSSTSITSKYDRTWQDKAKEAARMRMISYKVGGANENAG